MIFLYGLYKVNEGEGIYLISNEVDGVETHTELTNET